MTAFGIAYSRKAQVITAIAAAGLAGLCALGARDASPRSAALSASGSAALAVESNADLKTAQAQFRQGPDAFSARFYFTMPMTAAGLAKPDAAARPTVDGATVRAAMVPLPPARPQFAAVAPEAVPLPQPRPKPDDDAASLLGLAKDPTTAVYVIATGAFVIPDGTMLQGGSGTVATHNNPAMQSDRNGPIPEGLWTTGPTQSMISTFANGMQHRETGIFLTPTSSDQAHGRDRAVNKFGQREAFAIHPDNSRGKLTNIGCISFLAADAAKVFAARDAGLFDKILVIGYPPNAPALTAGRQTKTVRDAALRTPAQTRALD